MWLRTLLSRWLTVRCAICAIAPAEALVCRGCREDFVASSAQRCTRCAIRLPSGARLCATCLRHPPHFDATLALADYATPIDGLVVALKFGHRLELAPVLGGLLAECARSLGEPRPVLLPVPLAFQRLAEPGFNQSFEIGRGAAG